MTKKLKLIVITILSLVLITGCYSSETEHSNGADVINKIEDVYLYMYTFEHSELPNEFKEDYENNYILFVSSLDLSKIDKSEWDELQIDIKTLYDFGERILELENIENLTTNLFLRKVEMKEYKKYNYFIFRVNKNYSDVSVEEIDIKYKNSSYKIIIDMYMEI